MHKVLVVTLNESKFEKNNGKSWNNKLQCVTSDDFKL